MTSLVSMLALWGCSQSYDPHGADIIIINGNVTTLNENMPEVEALAIDDGYIIAVGDNDVIMRESGKNSRIIDAHGRRVIPGLIDSHIHFIRQGNMPGHTVPQAEKARSIAELIEILKAESPNLRDGDILTVMGGFVIKQFAENRMPTNDELTAAFPVIPVFVQHGFDGPSVVNNAGLALLSSKGFSPPDSGVFTKGAQASTAFKWLQSLQSDKGKLRGLQRYIQFANSVGLTGIHDQGGTNFPNASAFNTFTDYQTFNTCFKITSCLNLRTRIQHVVYDQTSEDILLEQKLNNTWQGFGSDMARYWSVGEHIVSFPINGKVNPLYEHKARLAAKTGWTHEQHSVSDDENKQHLVAIKNVHQTYDISKLRWSLSHVFELGAPGTEAHIEDIKSLGMGLKVQNHAYYTVTDAFPLGRSLGETNAGPYFKTLKDAGITLGGGTDGPLLGPLNPWYSIYYMVTGNDVNGELVNSGETLGREEALELYTRGSAWFSFDEDNVGSIEVDKWADVTILDQDYFDIPSQEIPNIKADITIVDGKIVYENSIVLK